MPKDKTKSESKKHSILKQTQIKGKNNDIQNQEYKNNQIKAIKHFLLKKSKSLLFSLLILLIIKLSTITSKLINFKNKKRYLSIVHISSIKLKIDESGENIIFFNGTFKWCDAFKYPDEIYINRENQSIIMNSYNLSINNSEIILKWHNPLENTNCMFRDCNKITEIDLSNFDDSKLQRMHYMFHGCSSLRSINMSHLKTPIVHDIGSLFRACTSLKSINLENLNSAGVTGFHYVFQNCYGLISINFPNINTLKATLTTHNFDNCNQLKYLNLENAKIKTEDISIFSIINSNFIICTHSPKLINIIETNGATLNCSQN